MKSQIIIRPFPFILARHSEGHIQLTLILSVEKFNYTLNFWYILI